MQNKVQACSHKLCLSIGGWTGEHTEWNGVSQKLETAHSLISNQSQGYTLTDRGPNNHQVPEKWGQLKLRLMHLVDDFRKCMCRQQHKSSARIGKKRKKRIISAESDTNANVTCKQQAMSAVSCSYNHKNSYEIACQLESSPLQLKKEKNSPTM